MPLFVNNVLDAIDLPSLAAIGGKYLTVNYVRTRKGST
jgi:hypothetical protein